MSKASSTVARSLCTTPSPGKACPACTRTTSPTASRRTETDSNSPSAVWRSQACGSRFIRASSAPAVVSFGLFCLSLGIFARLSGRQSRHVDLDRRFGDMSYPVYLVHSGVIVLVSLVATGYLAHAAAIGLTLLIAVALIAAVEAPMRSVRARVRRAAL